MTGTVARDFVRALCATSLLFTAMLGTPAGAQQPQTPVQPLELPVGRSFPLRSEVVITRVSIADPEVADVIVISENEVVINSIKPGETDAIIWLANNSRLHYRIQVHSPSDRKQIAISVKFAEVRRNALRNIGLSGLYRDNHTRAGTGRLNSDNAFDAQGNLASNQTPRFLTVLSDLGTRDILAFLDAEETRGNARLLAEPNIMAGNKDTASFLAGGELPIPVVQGGGAGGQSPVTVQFREFGIRLKFIGEILNDSLIRLNIVPEVSSLDFANAITLQGFRIPALRTRRINSTLDVRRDQSLIISGLFDAEDEYTRTGVPVLKDIPIIGALFSSTQWQRNDSELLVVVTPVIIDPLHPRAQDLLRFAPDTTRPATDALKTRKPPEPKKP